jgi:hypothetical protein
MKSNLHDIPFDVGIEIYKYLNRREEKNLSKTCRNMRRLYIYHIIPKPKRDVFISITDRSKKPLEYNFNRIIFDKNDNPKQVEFDSKMVPCDNCDTCILCTISKPCRQCVIEKVKCTYSKKSVKRLRYNWEGEYVCMSPFNCREHLRCIRKADVGLRKCEKCKELKKCGHMSVFNGCGIRNCSRRESTCLFGINDQVIVTHYHMLCESCFTSLPSEFIIKVQKNSVWNEL